MFGLKRSEGFSIVLVYKKLIDFLYVLELVFIVTNFYRRYNSPKNIYI